MSLNLVNNQYSLSIRIFSDGFSLYVYDEKYQAISRKFEKQEYIDEQEFVQKMFESHKEIHADYKNICIICESAYHTLVPDIIFNTDIQKDLLKLQHPVLPDTCRIFHVKQENLQNVLIFALEDSLTKGIYTHFQQITPESHLVHVIKKIISGEKDKFILWIRPKEIDCIVFHHQKIVLLNKYSYESPEDITYHVLNIYQQLELNPNELMLEIFTDENHQAGTLLENYISSVTIKTKQSAYEDYQWEI